VHGALRIDLQHAAGALLQIDGVHGQWSPLAARALIHVRDHGNAPRERDLRPGGWVHLHLAAHLVEDEAGEVVVQPSTTPLEAAEQGPPPYSAGSVVEVGELVVARDEPEPLWPEVLDALRDEETEKEAEKETETETGLDRDGEGERESEGERDDESQKGIGTMRAIKEKRHSAMI